MPVPTQSILKKRLGRIITSEARRQQSDADLQLVPKRHEQTRPRDIRNRLPMVHTLEGVERLITRISKKGQPIDVVEGHMADKGTERLTGSRERPISDQIEFGLGRIVAVQSDVVADMLDPVCEKFTLLRLESDTVLHKDRGANTFEVCQESVQRRGP